MKKLALILFLFLCTSAVSQAYIDSQYMTTEQYLVNTGYSAEAAKVGSIATQDPYRENYVEEMTPKNVFKRVYWYLNPGAMLHYDFYNHNIDFNNTSWKDF